MVLRAQTRKGKVGRTMPTGVYVDDPSTRDRLHTTRSALGISSFRGQEVRLRKQLSTCLRTVCGVLAWSCEQSANEIHIDSRPLCGPALCPSPSGSPLDRRLHVSWFLATCQMGGCLAEGSVSLKG